MIESEVDKYREGIGGAEAAHSPAAHRQTPSAPEVAAARRVLYAKARIEKT